MSLGLDPLGPWNDWRMREFGIGVPMSSGGLDTPGPQYAGPPPEYGGIETPPPRAIPAPIPIMPPPPGLDQMQPEVGQFIPHQRPDLLTGLLSGFAQLPYGGAALLGRHADPLAYLLLGLASGYGRARLGNYRAQEQNTSELNRRFGLAAAERNRINIEASKAADKERIDRAHKESDAAAKEKADAATKAAEDAKKAAADAAKEAQTTIEVTPEEAAKRGIPYRPGMRVPIPPRITEPRPGRPALGKVMPTLNNETKRLRDQAAASLRSSFGVPTTESDSLTAKADSLSAAAGQLREAMTPEDVHAIQWPNMPAAFVKQIAQAIRIRLMELGGAH